MASPSSPFVENHDSETTASMVDVTKYLLSHDNNEDADRFRFGDDDISDAEWDNFYAHQDNGYSENYTDEYIAEHFAEYPIDDAYQAYDDNELPDVIDLYNEEELTFNNFLQSLPPSE